MEHNNHPDLDLQHDEMNNNLPRIHSKKSLSKFGPFNNQSSSHLTTNNLSGNNNNHNNDSDEEDYGKHFDPSFGPAPIKKEIILPIQPKSDINDDDNEDYGRFDPSFGPAPIKKDLISPASSEAMITALRREPSDEEDYGGHFDPSFGPAPIKKDLISLGSSEGLASVSSKGGQSQSNNKKKDKGGDDEDYGHFDPSFGPAPIKKDLISPASSEAITTNLRREPSDDEDYGGHFDPSFGPAPIKKEGIQVPSSSSNNSHQGSGSAAGGGGEEDDDYGDIDPNYKADHVAKTSSGNFIVLPEIQKKTIKKTLSKYGGSSSQQLTSGNSFSTMKKTESSDNEDYGIKHANNNHDEFGTIPIRQTRIPLSASSPKNSAYIFDDQRKMSFQKMTLESDEDEEDYGTLDPNYKAEKVAVTSSGHFVVLPESNENSKKIKKTLSKYGNSPDAKQPDPFKPVISPNIASKKDDSDEEYGPIVSDTPQQNQRKQKDFRANGTGDKKVMTE